MPLLVVTRSEKGAIAVAGGERAEVGAEPVAAVVDTTGAGDLFAAGFLAGQAQGRGLEDSLRIGAIAAAEVISHYGARPEADLKAGRRRLGYGWGCGGPAAAGGPATRDVDVGRRRGDFGRRPGRLGRRRGGFGGHERETRGLAGLRKVP